MRGRCDRDGRGPVQGPIDFASLLAPAYFAGLNLPLWFLNWRFE
jgi:hypothetical protein